MPNRSLLVVAHLLGWLFFYSTILGFINLSRIEPDLWSSIWSVDFLYFFLFFPLLFYSNLFFFTPKFLLQDKYIIFFLAFLIFLVISLQTQPFDHLLTQAQRPGRMPPNAFPEMNGPMPQPGKRLDIVSIVLFLLAWVLSTAIPLAKAWQDSEARARKAEHDRTKAELSFLKAQIHPHFLFNTLNNLYAMALTGHESLPNSLLKLSNIMRYVTDDVRNDFVPLEQEIECIQDYIDLQKLRLGSNPEVKFDVTGEMDSKKIAPLLLMTFVENAFKYGVSKHEKCRIEFHLDLDSRGIMFYSKNKAFDRMEDLDSTGIGIENTKKRLAHLYPNKHLLHIVTNNGQFSVQLVLLD